MDTKAVKKLMNDIEKHKKYLADRRDKLDETISEMNQLVEDCEEAMDYMDSARDALSRLV